MIWDQTEYLFTDNTYKKREALNILQKREAE